MQHVDWYGNDGRCHPARGTLEKVECGVCGAQMNVERNVLGATSYVESAAGRSHRYDRFTCPNLERDWHKRIFRLKKDVYIAEINEVVDYEKKKEAARMEIMEILEANAAR